jgi:hypothetical protein
MNADKVAPPAPAPPPQQNADADLKALCEKIRREVSLTPPAVIDALCEGVPTRPICLKAAYVKEVLELASMLNRGHLLRFTADCR